MRESIIIVVRYIVMAKTQDFPDYEELKKVPKYGWTYEWFNSKMENIKGDATKLNKIYALILHHNQINSKKNNKKTVPYGGTALKGGSGIHYGPNNTIPADLAQLICAYLYVTDMT